MRCQRLLVITLIDKPLVSFNQGVVGPTPTPLTNKIPGEEVKMPISDDSFCPLLLLRVKEREGQKAVCIESKCAWWLQKEFGRGDCSIHRIAEILDKSAIDS